MKREGEGREGNMYSSQEAKGKGAKGLPLTKMS